ncbi:MAG: cupin domain-containing protein [Anaerolineae bacterium]|nr:cupin domain-containing protein [Anaerolineae bacterium]
MSNYIYFTALSGLTSDVPPDSILSRTLYDTTDVRAILFDFARGQELSEHTAALPAILYFLSGEATLTLDGEEKEARAGTWVHMPPQLSHRIVAHTPVTMLLLIIKKETSEESAEENI